jgi:hypothetical protein
MAGLPIVYQQVVSKCSDVRHIFSFRGRILTQDIHGLTEKLFEIVDNEASRRTIENNSAISFDLSRADPAYLKARRFVGLCEILTDRITSEGLSIKVDVKAHENLREEIADLYQLPLSLEMEERVGALSLTRSEPLDVTEWIDKLARVSPNYSQRVCTAGVKFCSFLNQPERLEDIEVSIRDCAPVRFDLPLLTAGAGPDIEDNIGILCLFKSGALRAFGRVLWIADGYSVAVELTNPLSLLDPDEPIAVDNEKAGPFACYGTLFGVIL